MLMLSFAGILTAQNIAIPDSVLKSKLLASSAANSIAQDNMGNNIQIDVNGDGEISIAEALAVYGLNISNSSYNPVGPFVSDMTGIDGFANLRNLNCAVNQINTLDLTFLGALRTLDCSYNNLTALDLSNLIQIEHLNCAFNELTALDVSMLTTLQELNCRVNAISALDVSSLVNLQLLDVSGNTMTDLDVSALSILGNLDFSANQIQSIDLSGNPLLTSLSLRDNLIPSIDVSVVPNLTSLDVSGNLLTEIDISDLTELFTFSCRNNQISTLDFTGLSGLWLIFADGNLLTSLDLAPVFNLQFLDCSNNQITALDLASVPQLGALVCTDNLLTTIDGSTNFNLQNIDCKNNQLETLFLKNGSITTGSSNFDFSGNANLHFICADEAEQALIQSKIVEYGYTDCLVNTYCSFVPGGDFNTMDGTVSFDADNNGCNPTDPKQPHLKLAIIDGANTGATFTTLNGNYNFYTLAGSFTVTPQVENPSFFTITPANALALFADTNQNIATNDFCVAANGVHPDIEIVIAPLIAARPGSDVDYKIVYKNKGNQIVSGNVLLGYDDSVLDLVSATTTPDAVTAGQLQWNYANLMPFESRSIIVTLNVNGPTETPPVNLADVLTYTAEITPTVGDEFPGDNQFTFNHTVVNAWDPNEIICLEGENVPTETAGEYLHYIANFENLGTAEAENVVVRINVNPDKYDIQSLQLLNTSHPSYTRVTGNTVEFIFEGINLAAASGNPPVGGHGNVLFKIKTNSNLVAGDHVEKKADIYFDYNAPVQTLPADTVFQQLSNPENPIDPGIVLYPNPVKNIVNIQGNSPIQLVELFDAQGRILQSSTENGNVLQFDLTSRADGIYFIRITTDKGIKVEKLVKQ